MRALDRIRVQAEQRARLLRLPANMYMRCDLPRPRHEYKLLFTSKDKEAGPRKIFSAR